VGVARDGNAEDHRLHRLWDRSWQSSSSPTARWRSTSAGRREHRRR